MSRAARLTGQVHGKLTVIKREENDRHGKTMWLCRCVCGNKEIIRGRSLISGNTKSCGCRKGKAHAAETQQKQQG